jgi:DNA topoisomerase-3
VELIIAEKPSVARDIARVLGVRASQGEHYQSDRYAITW